MPEKPIICSTPMIQAIERGLKKETRRLVSGKALQWLESGFFSPEFVSSCQNQYGLPGDRLWVRETFSVNPVNREFVYKSQEDEEEMEHAWKWKPSIFMPKLAARIWLTITDIRIERLNDISESDAISEGIEPVVFPSFALEPEPTFYKIYKDCDHSEDPMLFSKCPILSFKSLWQLIHGCDSWEKNPWVWVIKFDPLGLDNLE